MSDACGSVAQCTVWGGSDTQQRSCPLHVWRELCPQCMCGCVSEGAVPRCPSDPPRHASWPISPADDTANLFSLECCPSGPGRVNESLGAERPCCVAVPEKDMARFFFGLSVCRGLHAFEGYGPCSFRRLVKFSLESGPGLRETVLISLLVMVFETESVGMQLDALIRG